MTDDSEEQNPLDSLLGYQLRRASNAIMADLSRRLHYCELKPAEASALLLIQANPGMTQGAVGRILGIKSANMVPLAGSLERRRLLRRERVDGRTHGLRITQQGSAVCARVQKAIKAQEAVIEAAISTERRDALLQALERTRRSFHSHGAAMQKPKSGAAREEPASRHGKRKR